MFVCHIAFLSTPILQFVQVCYAIAYLANLEIRRGSDIRILAGPGELPCRTRLILLHTFPGTREADFNESC